MSVREEVARNRVRRIKSQSNKILATFVAVFVLGYLFFFTSTLWLPPTYTGAAVTPIGSTVSFNDRNITVANWSYSPEEKRMEIIIKIDNLSIDGIDRYDWTLRDKNGKLRASVTAETDDMVVVVAEKVSRRWTEVALRMRLKAEDMDENPDFGSYDIYMSDKEVNEVSHIPESRSMAEYMQVAVDTQVNGLQKQIEALEKESGELNRQISEANKKIEELTADMEHQTTSEKAITENAIAELNTTKEQAQKQLEDNETDVAELQEKIRYIQG